MRRSAALATLIGSLLVPDSTSAQSAPRATDRARAGSSEASGPSGDARPPRRSGPGSEVEADYQPDAGLLIAGTLAFFPPYIAGFVGAATDTTYNRGWLFVPVIGHAVFASTTTTYIGPLFTGLLWAGTFVQALGAVLLTLGFALDGSPTPPRLLGPVVGLAPVVGGDAVGLVVFGRY